MKLIDLSVLIENTPSEPMSINVKRFGHKYGAKKCVRNLIWNRRLPFKIRLKSCWQYLSSKHKLKAKDFPQNAFLSLDIVTMPTHMGTHIDAPYHYGPTAEGKVGDTVDKLPLEWFYGDAIRLDLRHIQPGTNITINDLEASLNAINTSIKPQDIVLIWTGTDKLWGQPSYFTKAPGMSAEAVLWLIKKGVKLIGIDTYGFDRPIKAMLADFAKTGNNSHLWPAHFIGRDYPYIQIERLANLELLPDSGFKLACFPLKIKGLDASWVRAVAMVD